MVIDPMYTRLSVVIYFIFACHWIGYLLMRQFHPQPWNLLQSFAYTIPFAVVFGINWKLAMIFVAFHLVLRGFKGIYTDIAMWVVEMLLYMTPTIAYYVMK